MANKRFLTVQELSELLGIHKNSIYNMIAPKSNKKLFINGHLLKPKRIANSIRFDREELDSFLKESIC